MNIETLKGLERNAIIVGAKLNSVDAMKKYLQDNGVTLHTMKDMKVFYKLAVKYATKKVVLV